MFESNPKQTGLQHPPPNKEKNYVTSYLGNLFIHFGWNNLDSVRNKSLNLRSRLFANYLHSNLQQCR